MGVRQRVGHGTATRRSVAWLTGLIALLGCQNTPESIVEPVWPPDGDATLTAGALAPFSGAHVIERASRLAEPDVGGEDTPTDADRARRRGVVIADLAALGIRTQDWVLADRPLPPDTSVDAQAATSTGAPHAVIGVLDGRSSDVILLVAGDDPTSLDGRSLDPVERASGTAALLELGRVLAARSRPYTVWLCFLDEPPADPEWSDPGREGVPSAASAVTRGFDTSGLFLDALSRRRVLDRVRVIVLFAALADPDLRVVRDLRSHRVHRETFWESARSLGLEQVFVEDAAFGSPETAHVEWLDRGLRNVVSIVGERPTAAPEPVGDGAPPRARTDEEAKAATIARLDELGVVTLDAIDRISSRFERIDRFSRDPISSERWEVEPAAGGDPMVERPVE